MRNRAADSFSFLTFVYVCVHARAKFLKRLKKEKNAPNNFLEMRND